MLKSISGSLLGISGLLLSISLSLIFIYLELKKINEKLEEQLPVKMQEK